MASPMTRRPWPALVSLVALLLLTGLVWWRVLHRGGASVGTGTPCPTAAPSSPAANTQSLPSPDQVTVQVLNSTSRTGIAAKARTTLTGYGFRSPKQATNDRPHKHIPGVAEIRYGPSAEKAAKLLSFYFPGARLVTNGGKSTVVVVSLGERYRAVASASSVTAAMKQQHYVTGNPQPQPSGRPSC